MRKLFAICVFVAYALAFAGVAMASVGTPAAARAAPSVYGAYDCICAATVADGSATMSAFAVIGEARKDVFANGEREWPIVKDRAIIAASSTAPEVLSATDGATGVIRPNGDGRSGSMSPMSSARDPTEA